MKNLIGTLLSLFICVITLPTAFFYPALQIEASKSRAIYRFVEAYIVDQNAANKCSSEVIWTGAIYIALSIAITILFFILSAKMKVLTIRITGILFTMFLLLQFYILQVPYYLFQIGTLYNCESDGQTGMAILVSSPLVSFTLLLFGISYDIIQFKLHNSKWDAEA